VPANRRSSSNGETSSGAINFRVRKSSGPPQLDHYPTVLLRPDNWNDYSFRTLFNAELFLGPKEVVSLGEVKILQRGQTEGDLTPLPPQFKALTSNYCSLGQAYSYYEALGSLDRDIASSYLEALRDIAYRPEIRDSFEEERGFETSLLRFDGARSALEEATSLFRGERRRSSLSFSYQMPDGDEPIHFAFGHDDGLPDRICVVIGYNGAGKTRLLGKLAHVAYHDERTSKEPSFVRENGGYVGDRPEFGAVITVSYSAFDTFALPGHAGSHRAAERNYTYCGLRRHESVAASQSDDDPGVSRELKDLDALSQEFHEARERALEKDRQQVLIETADALLREPSFRTTVELPRIDGPARAWHSAFDTLSAGHKIVLNIIVQLSAYLERRSLVLVDEPEVHLHPPLVAALLRSIGRALETYESYAIVATHSPVVLQEVPARSVIVLRRSFELVTPEEPSIETFGENVGLLTRHVFNLDSTETDYQAVLRELAQTMSLEEIESLFPRGMSSQARSLVATFQRQTRDE
jgi:predicted ATPase